MNNHEKLAIKAVIMEQIAALSAETSGQGASGGSVLRLEQLNSALNRIEASNFGECFKCEKAIPPSCLRVSPERMICDDCLEGRGR